jgi:hypothetical protein
MHERAKSLSERLLRVHLATLNVFRYQSAYPYGYVLTYSPLKERLFGFALVTHFNSLRVKEFFLSALELAFASSESPEA